MGNPEGHLLSTELIYPIPPGEKGKRKIIFKSALVWDMYGYVRSQEGTSTSHNLAVVCVFFPCLGMFGPENSSASESFFKDEIRAAAHGGPEFRPASRI